MVKRFLLPFTADNEVETQGALVLVGELFPACHEVGKHGADDLELGGLAGPNLRIAPPHLLAFRTATGQDRPCVILLKRSECLFFMMAPGRQGECFRGVAMIKQKPILG